MFEYDKHYKDCQQLNKPFIKARINPKHGNYFVQIDMMSCDYDLTTEEQNEIKKLIQHEAKLVKSTLEFKIDKEVSWFDGISSKSVDNFCVSLYDLVQKYHA